VNAHLPPWLGVGFPKVVPESSATGITSRGAATNSTADSVTGGETGLVGTSQDT
jgi:hypothetical protein